MTRLFLTEKWILSEHLKTAAGRTLALGVEEREPRLRAVMEGLPCPSRW